MQTSIQPVPSLAEPSILARHQRSQINRIVLAPDEAVKPHVHIHRDEIWIVAEGTGQAIIDGETRLLTEGETLHIPFGAEHSISNPGYISLTLIEVQIGSYLGVDDVSWGAI